MRPANPPPDWLKFYKPDYDPEEIVRFLNPDGTVHFESNPGEQTWALNCPFSELLVGGRRGGGKSKFLIATTAMGDLSLPFDDPARLSFLNDKDYRALLLREEYQSMAEFVEEAIEFFRPFGGVPAGDPKYVDFETGARVYFNHLGDEAAFEKYKGWNLTFIGIEELTQVRTLRRYLKLKGSLRSVDRIRDGKRFPPLRTRLVSTTNPDGPGATWVADRFVDVFDKQGNLIPPNTPMRDTFTQGVRIFIPFPKDSNPYLSLDTAAGQDYHANLLAQDEVTRKQWIDGDWHAGSSSFFTEYRSKGPVGDHEKEHFPWACHIVKPVKLEPWWFRWGSGDWGYDHPAAFHKYVMNDRDKRVHVYDEMQVRHVGSFELGAMLAKWWFDDLVAMKAASQECSVIIHLGDDAFRRDDRSKTKAQNMEAGIKQVLGPYGAMLLKYNEDENDAMLRNPKMAQRMYENRKKQFDGHMFIALKPVYIERVVGWDYVRNLLRFHPAVLQLQTDEERTMFLHKVMQEQGWEAYEQKRVDLQKIKPEVLPKCVIWNHCVQLDRCLKAAKKNTSNDDDPSKESKREDVLKFNADDEGHNGDDALESYRNGAVAFDEMQNDMPRSQYIQGAIDGAREQYVEAFGEELTDPTRLAQIAATQAARFDKLHSHNKGGFTPARASSSRHRVQ